MIVVDTSALLSIILLEPMGLRCGEALERAERVLISAATVTEALIVADRRGLADEMERTIEQLELEITPLTDARARRAARAYGRWGRGVHPARLNYGDCFAYALAEEHGCPLLFVGDDFARTDVQRCL